MPKVVEYLHLPVQSGSDRILARMNRGYTVARYLELIDELKATVPDIALSTDIIVGFPGETDADFAETVAVVERGRLRQCLRVSLLTPAGHARRRTWRIRCPTR